MSENSIHVTPGAISRLVSIRFPWKGISKCLFRHMVVNKRTLFRLILVVITAATVSLCAVYSKPKSLEPQLKELWVNCAKLIANDSREIRSTNRTKFESGNSPLTISNCDYWLLSRQYPMKPTSRKEESFPIAYSILLYNHVEQFERLLRAIYAPQNMYCLHVDRKADSKVHHSVQAIASCFANVFVASKLERIVYASFSRLQADLNCFNDLLERDSKWHYLINLSGEMFPLKTNREIVEILQIYNGSNDILGFYDQRAQKQNFKWKQRYEETRSLKWTVASPNYTKPPHNITVIKGSAYNVFSRSFLEFVMTDPIVQEFLEWTKPTYSPDEIFWASLQFTTVNPVFKSPGGFAGDPHTVPWHAAHVKWLDDPDCGEKILRDICIPDFRNLPGLVHRKEFFVNKLLIYTYDYTVLVCLDEHLRNRTKNIAPFDTSYYQALPIARKFVH